MHTPILITGSDHPLQRDLIYEFLNRSTPLYVVSQPEIVPPGAPQDERIHSLVWAQRSLISTGSLIYQADREMEGLSNALVLCGPEVGGAALHEMEGATIEQRCDHSYKGYLFLLREILALYMRRGAGELTVVWYDGGVEVLPPFDASLKGMIRGLVKSLLVYYEEEPITIRGLQISGGESREGARWVVEMMIDKVERTAGRWHQMGQRGGLLPFMRG